MNVLVLNCGSSSVKFQVMTIEPPRRLARGRIERLGGAATGRFEAAGREPHRVTVRVPDHAAGVRLVFEWLAGSDRKGAPAGAIHFEAVGHRVVHGGPQFTAPAPIDDDVIAGIEALETLAPLHNVPSLAGIRACRSLVGPGIPMVAVFDTAFHATLPIHAASYAIPHDLARRHGIRRYGFHGTSYRYILSRYCEMTGIGPGDATLVALHLGSGCSAVAIQHGESVDTSMGFTPLEGLVMGTRSGDIDPALVGYLARQERVSVAEVERWLNEGSGLRGISGRSADMRDLLERERDDPQARLAVEVFCYRARKYVGAYLAALGGAQAVVFTGGIGENAPEVRSRICEGMSWCGLRLEPTRNLDAIGRDGLISADDARLRAYVIPTDEELLIARDTAECVGGDQRERHEA